MRPRPCSSRLATWKLSLNLCARLGLDPSGRVHDVAGGFLIKLDRPATGPVPGAIRLRSLARDFYLPVDAELVPALLDDEADGLVRDWGLVFLPGGRILRFDREARVDLDRLVEVRPRPRRAWASLARAPPPRRSARRDRPGGARSPARRVLPRARGGNPPDAARAGRRSPAGGKGGPTEPPTEDAARDAGE